MKKLFYFLTLILLFTASDSFSQYGLSRGYLYNSFNANWKGRNVEISYSDCGFSTSGYAGLILAELDGNPNTPFYCMDMCTPIEFGDTIVDSLSYIPEAIYITLNYYPAVSPVLSDSNEACAVQLAIWYFRNGIIIDSVRISTDQDIIRARAKTIAEETINKMYFFVPVNTIEILLGTEPESFYIRTQDTAENPVSVSDILLEISNEDTIVSYYINTDSTGNSPEFQASIYNNFISITATAKVQIQRGAIYCGLNSVKQLLVLAKTVTGFKTAYFIYGYLPVDLSSFNVSVNNNNVTLNWITSSETNNSGFDIERKSADSEQWSKIGFAEGHGNTNISYEYNFMDYNVASGKYNYRIKQIDFNGNYEYHNLTSDVNVGTPTKFSLSQNYPNPFNPSTTINFDMPTDGFVILKTYNTSGKEVATLLNETRLSGYHNISFNPANLSSGVYYYRLESNGISKVM